MTVPFELYTAVITDTVTEKDALRLQQLAEDNGMEYDELISAIEEK